MNKSDTIAIIRSLLSSTKSKYSVCRLNVDFKKETGIDIPLFGYGNLSDFLHSIPDTVQVSGMYPIQQVHLVGNEKSSHIVSLVNRTRKSDFKNKSSKGQLRIAKLNNSFRNGNIQKSPNIDGLTDLDRFKGIKISPETNSRLENSASTCLNSSDSQVSLMNFLTSNDNIPLIDIKNHAQVGEYVEVCPDHINDPHKFYFRFRKFQKKFADLTDKMQSFYEKSENIPQMSETAVKPKLLCAVFHKIRRKPKWVRGEITQIVSKSHVHVTFIDYGCGAEVSKRNLRFLHRDFGSLPRQAVLGSLANIRPSKGESKWSCDAVERFSALARDMDLIAGVVAINDETCSVSVALSCTRGLEYHINDTLVKEGYAEFWRNVDNSGTVGNLILPVSEKSWKKKFGKTVFTEDDVLNSTTNLTSPTRGTPIFYYSDSPWGNKKLKQMFSDVE